MDDEYRTETYGKACDCGKCLLCRARRAVEAAQSL
jgi:hypothetical protein